MGFYMFKVLKSIITIFSDAQIDPNLTSESPIKLATLFFWYDFVVFEHFLIF